MGSLYLWGYSIQEIGSDVVIGRSIYRVVVIDGSLCSRFYGMPHLLKLQMIPVLTSVPQDSEIMHLSI